MNTTVTQDRLDDLSFLGTEAGAPWDPNAARALMHETDALVADSGANGTEPTIAAAAFSAFQAFHAADGAGVSAACAAIARRVSELTGRPVAYHSRNL